MTKQKGIANILLLVGALIISLTLPAVLKLVQQPQDTRRQAEEGCIEGCDDGTCGWVQCDVYCDGAVEPSYSYMKDLGDCPPSPPLPPSEAPVPTEPEPTNTPIPTSTLRPTNTPKDMATPTTTEMATPTPIETVSPIPCSCINPNRQQGTRFCDGRNHVLRCDASALNVCRWNDIQACLYGCHSGYCLTQPSTTPTLTPSLNPSPIPSLSPQPTNTPRPSNTPILVAPNCIALVGPPGSSPQNFYEGDTISLTCNSDQTTHHFNFHIVFADERSTKDLSSSRGSEFSGSIQHILTDLGSYIFECQTCDENDNCSPWGGIAQ